MPIRTSHLDNFKVSDSKKIFKKIDSPTRAKKNLPQNSKWVVMINHKQYGHLFDSKNEAFAYIVRHDLSKKLPSITRVNQPLTVKCGVCREDANILVYRNDKIIYLCKNKHIQEIKRI